MLTDNVGETFSVFSRQWIFKTKNRQNPRNKNVTCKYQLDHRIYGMKPFYMLNNFLNHIIFELNGGYTFQHRNDTCGLLVKNRSLCHHISYFCWDNKPLKNYIILAVVYFQLAMNLDSVCRILNISTIKWVVSI